MGSSGGTGASEECAAMDRDTNIRPVEIRDVPRLVALMRALAAEEGSSGALEADEASLLRDGFGPAPRWRAFVAAAGAEAVGYVSYTIGYSIWAGRSTLLVDDVFVDPEYRGMSLGRKLMEAIGRVCLEDGHAFARWTVELGNVRAMRFYERIGARLARKGLCTWVPLLPDP